jgi:hypothetical protein
LSNNSNKNICLLWPYLLKIRLLLSVFNKNKVIIWIFLKMTASMNSAVLFLISFCSVLQRSIELVHFYCLKILSWHSGLLGGQSLIINVEVFRMRTYFLNCLFFKLKAYKPPKYISRLKRNWFYQMSVLSFDEYVKHRLNVLFLWFCLIFVLYSVIEEWETISVILTSFHTEFVDYHFTDLLALIICLFASWHLIKHQSIDRYFKIILCFSL